MFCANCGTPNLETEHTCRKCSEPLVSPSGFAEMQARRRARRAARWPLVLLGVLVVLGALFLVAGPACLLGAAACPAGASKPGPASAAQAAARAVVSPGLSLAASAK